MRKNKINRQEKLRKQKWSIAWCIDDARRDYLQVSKMGDNLLTAESKALQKWVQCNLAIDKPYIIATSSEIADIYNTLNYKWGERVRRADKWQCKILWGVRVLGGRYYDNNVVIMFHPYRALGVNASLGVSFDVNQFWLHAGEYITFRDHSYIPLGVELFGELWNLYKKTQKAVEVYYP